jgi:hypothetical protein
MIVSTPMWKRSDKKGGDGPNARRNIMKKTLIVIGFIMLVSVIAFMSFVRIGASPYPIAAVEETIHKFSSDSGAPIMEMRKTSSTIRGSRFTVLDHLSVELRGKPLYNDIDEFLLQYGSDTVSVKVYYSLGNVESVEIRPSSTSPKQALAIKTAVTATYPDLVCRIISP